MAREAQQYGQRLQFLQGEVFAPDSRTRWDTWHTNNSSLDDYVGPVKLIDHPEGVFGVIQHQLEKMEGNAGLDIAGGRSGLAIRRLLRMGLLEKALVTNYRDRRSIVARLHPALSHVKGDIVTPKPWGQIIDWQEAQAPKGLALVMHRPVGGLQEQSPDFYKGATHLLLDMVRPGGVMFTQIPRYLRLSDTEEELHALCQSVSARPDVHQVICAENRPNAGGVRQAEDCVVIVKHEQL
ncbi:MAG TPA: hypothetical protein VNG32_05350 [Candidatus Dormibacteraeota bacterium]|nr:hypothetical protein [Candidatus Dormibacteraeota bacterium]